MKILFHAAIASMFVVCAFAQPVGFKPASPLNVSGFLYNDNTTPNCTSGVLPTMGVSQDSAVWIRNTARTSYTECVWNGASWIATSASVLTYPGAGIAVSAGTGGPWSTSLTAPAGTIVGTTDTQTLTNKTVNGVSVATFAFLDPTSSVQTQLNARLLASNNLSDLVSASTARTNLGLGTSATQSSGTFFQVANNLSEGTAATMRTNLGLGTSATVNTGTTGAVIGLLNATNTFTGAVDASGSTHYFPRVGTTSAITGSSCSLGEIALANDATAGQNLYFCTATNTWTQQLNSGASPVTFRNNGTIVGTGSGFNMTAGNGTLLFSTFSGGIATYIFSYDFSLIPTYDTIHADPNYCASTNGTTAMTCSFASTKALTAYTSGQCFDFSTDTPNPVSINIDGVAIKNLYDINGIGVLPAGVVTANAPFTACYDGTQFRLKSPSSYPTLVTTGFSATPTFTANSTTLTTFTITLTGNVTSSTFAGGFAGQQVIFKICQDSGGAHTFVFPASAKGQFTIGSTASKCNLQPFIFDGTSLYATSTGSTNL